MGREGLAQQAWFVQTLHTPCPAPGISCQTGVSVYLMPWVTPEYNNVTYGGGLHLCRVWRRKVLYSQPCLCDCPQQTPWTPRPGWASLVDHTCCVLSVVISREAVTVVCPCGPGPSAGFSLNPFTLTNHNHKYHDFSEFCESWKNTGPESGRGDPQTHCASGGWTELS